MSKIKLPKYKYSAYVQVDSEWKFMFHRNTEYQTIASLKQRFGKDYDEHPECYKIEKEMRVKSDL